MFRPSLFASIIFFMTNFEAQEVESASARELVAEGLVSEVSGQRSGACGLGYFGHKVRFRGR